MIRSIAGSIARPLAVAITGASGGAVPDLAADVRALFSANGGDFTGTMLDFTKTSRLYSDFEGTEADDGDTLALVVDDQENGALGAEILSTDPLSASSWTSVGTGATVTEGSGSITFAATGGATCIFEHDDQTTIVSGVSYQSFAEISAVTGPVNLDVGSRGPVASYVSAGPQTNYYNPATGPRIRITCNPGESVTITSLSVKAVLGNHAYQSIANSRPLSTTDAFGTRVAQPDGTDDHMDLPDGVLGDGTDHVHVFAAYALDNANSDSGCTLLEGAPGGNDAGVYVDHNGTTGQPRTGASDGGSAGVVSVVSYGRALTDNETLVRADLIQPTGSRVMRINGTQVVSNTQSWASLDDPGAAQLFGDDTNKNLAGTCHGIVILTGSRAMTAAEIATVEAYLADLASDTLLTADPDTVLSRVFRPATDLNVTDDFSSYADTAAFFADPANSDASNGTSTVTLDAANDRVVFTKSGSGVTAYRRSGDGLRVGFRYRVSLDNGAGGTGNRIQLQAGSTLGGSQYGSVLFVVGATGTIEFVAAGPKLYLQLIGIDAGIVYGENLRIEELPATGDYWDLLDDTRMYSDLTGTLVEAEDPVQLLLSKGRAETYAANAVGAPVSVGSDWTDNGDSTYSVSSVAASDFIVFADAFGEAGGNNVVLSMSADGDYQTFYQRTSTSPLYLVSATMSGHSGAAVRLSHRTALDGRLGINSTGAVSATVSNVSVRLVLGFPLLQNTANSRPTWALSGSPGVLTFDGTDDYFEAVDPDADLAITGDLTILSAVNVTDTATNKTLVSSGDSTVGTDVAYQSYLTSTEESRLEQADSTSSEVAASGAGAIGTGSVVLGLFRSGAAVTFVEDIQTVGSDTFTTVTTPTAGTAPKALVGIQVDESSDAYDGSQLAQLIVDRSLSLGLSIHAMRALTEKIA